MKSIKFAACIAIPVLACTTAYAGDRESSFSALQGVEAQAMSPSEMSSVYGQLTVDGLKAAIDAKLLPAHPVLDAAIDTAIDNHPRLAQAVVNVLTAKGY
jgi:hypothetical protein